MMDIASQSPTMHGDGQAGHKNWLTGLGFDAAKLGLLLYVLGMVTSSLYYSRFSIATLDLAKTQSILLGVYVVALYAVLPAGALFILRRIPWVGVIAAVFVAGLCGLNTILAYALSYRSRTLLSVVALTLALQFFFFADFPSLVRSLLTARVRIDFVLPPPRVKALLFALLFCAHFSQFWFPQIPAFLGGGKPLPVQVFTKTADLPANRFVMSKNQPKVNSAMDSYSLRLLYEADRDVYFVSDLKSDDNLIGYSVMRIKRDEILRMDYATPKWVQWKGDQ
jgi:hypothetical protein